ncbi:MAG: IPT/TIG domain-containing protein [Myxococcales bacterium]|nr:IPT/TIG domain-containing protein [Myxococcales bacterium]
MRLAALFASALAPFLILACAAPRDLGGRTDTGPGGLDPGDGSSIDDGSGPIDLDGGAPYAVFGVQASHGPYTGGTRIEIRGRGFSSKTRVKIGGVEVDPTTVVASDPLHVQVLTPPGEPGPADVEMIDVPTGQTAFLSGGFTYDSFYADPSSGATTGGTLITLTGRGTKWVTGTTATVDGKPCGDLAVKDETHLTCVAPAGTPGVKAISITTPDTVVVSARDAYTYADTTDGYRGGLAGDKLPGELKVIALVNPNGDLLPEATVVVRGSDGSIQTAKTSISGVASFAAPPPAPVTVTITKKCIQPTTFDGVKVRSVTAYLNPVMSVACISPEGEPPPTGARSRSSGARSGSSCGRSASSSSAVDGRASPIPRPRPSARPPTCSRPRAATSRASPCPPPSRPRPTPRPAPSATSSSSTRCPASPRCTRWPASRTAPRASRPRSIRTSTASCGASASRAVA